MSPLDTIISMATASRPACRPVLEEYALRLDAGDVFTGLDANEAYRLAVAVVVAVDAADNVQVWAIHDAVPDHLQIAVQLGAFAGLRVAEVSGLRVVDVDFIRGVVHPKQQWAGKPLKTAGSDQPIPIPRDLALRLSASVQNYPSEMMATNGRGTDRCGPWIIERAVRDVRDDIDGLTEGFRSTTYATIWRRC